MNALSRFLAGFKSGYRKQHAVTVTVQSASTEPQVKKRTAIVVICAVILLLAVGTYWLMSLQSGRGLPRAEDLGARVLGAGEALYAFAILGGFGLFAYLRRRKKHAGK
jgi:hypothetical protein